MPTSWGLSFVVAVLRRLHRLSGKAQGHVGRHEPESPGWAWDGLSVHGRASL